VLQHALRRGCRALGEIMGAGRSYQLLGGQSQALQTKALEGAERIFPQVSGTFQQFINTDVLSLPRSASQLQLRTSSALDLVLTELST